MAEAKNGYIGKITNSGTMVVNAPHSPKGKKGNSTVHKGGDLRTGKGGK